MAIRAAIGAGRMRLLRQLMVESVVLGVLGGLLGLVLAMVGVRILDAHRPDSLPDFVALEVNGRILVFTLLASLVCALLFGLLPALVASRTELHDAMREGDPRMSGGQHRLRVFLVVGEVALALILVVAAGVTSRALAGLLRLDGGFDGRQILTFRLSIPESRRRAAEEVRTFLDRLVTELRALPSVEEVSTSTLLPIDGPWETSFRSDTQPKLPPEKVQFAAFGYASPGYAKALGLRLLAGRWFEPTDDLTRPDVVVIDDELARDFYPEGAVGRKLLSNDGKTVREIIGVVHHVAAYGLAGPEPARHQFYQAIAQMKDSEGPRAPRSVSIAVRTRGRPELMTAPVVRTVTALDPELPVYELRTMEQLMGESLDAQRFATVQLSLFALLALVLAVVGLYAVLSYTVAQRTGDRHPDGARGLALGRAPLGGRARAGVDRSGIAARHTRRAPHQPAAGGNRLRGEASRPLGLRRHSARAAGLRCPRLVVAGPARRPGGRSGLAPGGVSAARSRLSPAGRRARPGVARGQAVAARLGTGPAGQRVCGGAAAGHHHELASGPQVRAGQRCPAGRIGQGAGDRGIEGLEPFGRGVTPQGEVPRLDAGCQPEPGDGVLQESDLLGDRVDEGDLEVVPGDRQRKPRKSRSRPRIEERMDLRIEHPEHRERIKNVLVRDGDRIKYRRQLMGAPPNELARQPVQGVQFGLFEWHPEIAGAGQDPSEKRWFLHRRVPGHLGQRTRIIQLVAWHRVFPRSPTDVGRSLPQAAAPRCRCKRRRASAAGVKPGSPAAARSVCGRCCASRSCASRERPRTADGWSSAGIRASRPAWSRSARRAARAT
jgi:hypothetical protein